MFCDAAMFYVKTMVCGVAINSLEITIILQPACNDVKIGLYRAHGTRLTEKRVFVTVLHKPEAPESVLMMSYNELKQRWIKRETLRICPRLHLKGPCVKGENLFLEKRSLSKLFRIFLVF